MIDGRWSMTGFCSDLDSVVDFFTIADTNFIQQNLQIKWRPNDHRPSIIDYRSCNPISIKAIGLGQTG